MTFRVQHTSVGETVVLTLSGDIAGRHAADLEALLDAERARSLVLDLGEAAVVDRAGVLLLARTEATGATLRNCPAYVREWIEREREAFESEIQRGHHVPEQEREMAQGIAKPAHEGTFQSADGLRIFFRSWQPERRARGVVAIVPGFNSHSGYYEWVAGQLTAIGLAVVAVDLRGRGKSDGERFYVTKFSDYVDDVAGLMKEAKSPHPELPVFLLGHSAGGVVSCL